MTTATSTQLGFGYNPGLHGATCAWGARWIVTQDGSVDFVPDRQSMIGTPEEKQELISWLVQVGSQPLETLREMLRSREVSTRASREVVLYEDERGVVVGNTNASAGYFYVAARFWLDGETTYDVSLAAIKPGARLGNGCLVVAAAPLQVVPQRVVVLAVNDAIDPVEYITWEAGSLDNTYTGHYFANVVEAAQDFTERS